MIKGEITLLEKVYENTKQQKKAVNLGLIPRFMRLLEEREKMLKKYEEEQKSDERETEELISKKQNLINDILKLNLEILDDLKESKIEAKKEIDKVLHAKKVYDATYEKNNNLSGRYFDNKN